MRNRSYLSVIGAISLSASFGQISATGLDSLLLKNANAVINEYHVGYNVKSPSSIEKHERYKVTVLNQGGRDLGEIDIYTGKGEEITSFTGTVRNSAGSVVTKIKLSDLKSYPAYPDFVFLSDNKVFHFSPVIQDYPYSVEYEQSVELKGMIAFDPWKPVTSESVSCDTSSYSITYPSGYKLISKSFNLSSEPVIVKEPYHEKITWSIGKIGAVSISSFVPPFESFMPCLYVMPESFTFDGYPGQVKDMAGYGKWLAQIQLGRSELDPLLTARLKSLTSGASDTRSKTEIVYKFLQQNTRYVAIMFGIGGHQPAPAREVASYGYGDCKGLSNYMKSMLAAIGIKSFYTVIGNGDKRIRFEEMPYFQTNHAILCVPNDNDTIWLECTTSYYKAGYIGYSNSNRKALIVTDNGGILVSMPRADSTNSYVITRSDLSVTSNGATSFQFSEYCKRNEEYETYLYWKDKEKDKTLKYLYGELPFRNYVISAYTITADTNDLACITTNFSGQFNKYATLAGKRLIIPLVPYKVFIRVPKIEPDRKIDIYIPDHLARTDTVNITVPPGFKYPLQNETKKFSNSVGTYKQVVQVKGKDIVVIRSVSIPAGTFPASKKDEVTEFYKKSHDIESASLICEMVI